MEKRKDGVARSATAKEKREQEQAERVTEHIVEVLNGDAATSNAKARHIITNKELKAFAEKRTRVNGPLSRATWRFLATIDRSVSAGTLSSVDMMDLAWKSLDVVDDRSRKIFLSSQRLVLEPGGLLRMYGEDQYNHKLQHLSEVKYSNMKKRMMVKDIKAIANLHHITITAEPKFEIAEGEKVLADPMSVEDLQLLSSNSKRKDKTRLAQEVNHALRFAAIPDEYRPAANRRITNRQKSDNEKKIDRARSSGLLNAASANRALERAPAENAEQITQRAHSVKAPVGASVAIKDGAGTKAGGLHPNMMRDVKRLSKAVAGGADDDTKEAYLEILNRAKMVDATWLASNVPSSHLAEVGITAHFDPMARTPNFHPKAKRDQYPKKLIQQMAIEHHTSQGGTNKHLNGPNGEFGAKNYLASHQPAHYNCPHCHRFINYCQPSIGHTAQCPSAATIKRAEILLSKRFWCVNCKNLIHVDVDFDEHADDCEFSRKRQELTCRQRKHQRAVLQGIDPRPSKEPQFPEVLEDDFAKDMLCCETGREVEENRTGPSVVPVFADTCPPGPVTGCAYGTTSIHPWMAGGGYATTRRRKSQKPQREVKKPPKDTDLASSHGSITEGDDMSTSSSEHFRRRSEGLCLLCGSPDHYAAGCDLCGLCKQKGHTKYNCPRSRARPTRTENSTTTTSAPSHNSNATSTTTMSSLDFTSTDESSEASMMTANAITVLKAHNDRMSQKNPQRLERERMEKRGMTQGHNGMLREINSIRAEAKAEIAAASTVNQAPPQNMIDGKSKEKTPFEKLPAHLQAPMPLDISFMWWEKDGKPMIKQELPKAMQDAIDGKATVTTAAQWMAYVYHWMPTWAMPPPVEKRTKFWYLTLFAKSAFCTTIALNVGQLLYRICVQSCLPKVVLYAPACAVKCVDDLPKHIWDEICMPDLLATLSKMTATQRLEMIATNNRAIMGFKNQLNLDVYQFYKFVSDYKWYGLWSGISMIIWNKWQSAKLHMPKICHCRIVTDQEQDMPTEDVRGPSESQVSITANPTQGYAIITKHDMSNLSDWTEQTETRRIDVRRLRCAYTPMITSSALSNSQTLMRISANKSINTKENDFRLTGHYAAVISAISDYDIYMNGQHLQNCLTGGWQAVPPPNGISTAL